MASDRLHYRPYRRRNKYVLTDELEIETPVSGYVVTTPYIELLMDGTLLVRPGYAWDGASGPTWDSPCTMRGSLVHDVFYQLLREGHIGSGRWHEIVRRTADRFLIDLCVEDGMWRLRGWLWYHALRWFGGRNARVPRRVPFEKGGL